MNIIPIEFFIRNPHETHEINGGLIDLFGKSCVTTRTKRKYFWEKIKKSVKKNLHITGTKFNFLSMVWFYIILNSSK